MSVASHVASVFGNELAEDTEIHTLHYSDKQLTCSSSISVFSVNSFTGASIIPPVNESTEDMEAPENELKENTKMLLLQVSCLSE